MKTYVAFLRGVNVGGKAMIKMADLQVALTKAGLHDVRTYIQSGNIIFASDETNTDKLVTLISTTILKDFDLMVGVAVFSDAQWQAIVAAAPKWWGSDPSWKHNLWILLKPFDIEEVTVAIGTLKPEIESVEPGKGVIYQSMSFQKFGQTSTGKISSSPMYKKMTIRNYNTATKIAALMS